MKHFLITGAMLFSFSLFAQQKPTAAPNPAARKHQSLLKELTQFTFVHISDLHVSDTISLVNSCDVHGAMAQCYLHEFAALIPKPAFVLATGDIANIGNGLINQYPQLTQFLYPQPITNPGIGAYHIDSAQTIPIYFAPGNHDYYTTLYPPGTLTQLNNLPAYSQNIAPDSDYAVTTAISVILFVRSGNDISYLISTDPKGSGLTDAQCNWIRNKLSLNSSKRKIIVMHHPAANLTGTICDGTPHSAIALPTTASMYNNRNTFMNICDSNQVDVVLAGHSHQNVVVDSAGNLINDNCTTCGTRYVQTGPAFNGCYRTITVDASFVTVGPALQSCPSTAINETEYSSNFSVYPNPSSDKITFETANAESITLYDIMGQKIKSVAVKSGQTKVEIDVSGLANGIYFYEIPSGDANKIARGKFVVEK